MPTAFVLSEADRSLLQEVIRELSNQRKNRKIGSLAPEDPQSPEVYIALPPSGGIPGLTFSNTQTGTGTPEQAGDIPGSAICDIYRILNGALQSIDKTEIVYNLSQTDITQIWISIRKTKFGLWVVDCPCS